ncbi:MAG: radical SAM protein [Phycisphaerae bacterium]|nr:radical SAM protein [Phycisphaerae bacterium]
MKTYTYQMKTGIVRTPEFERKGLATHGVNVGLKCGHECTYCSTPTMIRAHKAFKNLGLSAFNTGYAVIDTDTPRRVARDARHTKNRGIVQLCTISDAWSPEAQEYNLGHKCLEAILSEPGWMVRVLTKNTAVEKDFDVISKYRDRVLLGLSITATLDKAGIISITEPNASPIPERLRVMQKAKAEGLRTYAMLCPLLPGIADSPEQIEELVKTAVDFDAEEIFAEAVNPRGRGLILTQQALERAGFHNEAKAVEAIRSQVNWSQYVARLISNLQQSVRKHSDIKKLRFLLYPKGLEVCDLEVIKQDDAGVVWL